MLNILSGQETANVKSLPVAIDSTTNKMVQLDQGDWVKFNDEGKVVKATSYDGTAAVFPVYAGNIRFYDTQYHQCVDVVTSAACALETDKIDGSTFAEGMAVTIGADGITTTGATAANRVGFVIKVLANGAVQFVRA